MWNKKIGLKSSPIFLYLSLNNDPGLCNRIGLFRVADLVGVFEIRFM